MARRTRKASLEVTPLEGKMLLSGAAASVPHGQVEIMARRPVRGPAFHLQGALSGTILYANGVAALTGVSGSIGRTAVQGYGFIQLSPDGTSGQGALVLAGARNSNLTVVLQGGLDASGRLNLVMGSLQGTGQFARAAGTYAVGQAQAQLTSPTSGQFSVVMTPLN
jgi:hypothetical protein